MQSRSARVSIIVATRNAAGTLERCLRSVLMQTYECIELIIIDGASTDGTVSIIEHFGDLLDEWISEPDLGVYDAWNKGLSLSTGDWIYFLGADDYLIDDGVIAKFVSEVESFSKSPLIVYGQIISSDRFSRLSRQGRPWSEVRDRIGRLMPIPHPATFHSRRLFSLTGPFDRNFKIAGDYKKFLESIEYAEPCFLPGLLVAHHERGGLSTKVENRLLVVLEMLRARRAAGVTTDNMFIVDFVVAIFLRCFIIFSPFKL